MILSEDIIKSLITDHIFYRNIAKSAYGYGYHTFKQHHEKVVKQTEEKILLLEKALNELKSGKTTWIQSESNKTKDPIKLELIESVKRLV